jgi:aromatic-L-amino-acid decarboxylase
MRHVPPGLDAAAVSAHNLAIAQRINAAGRQYVTPNQLDGHHLLRISIGAERTERAHVAALWDALQAAAAGSGQQP